MPYMSPPGLVHVAGLLGMTVLKEGPTVVGTGPEEGPEEAKTVIYDQKGLLHGAITEGLGG